MHFVAVVVCATAVTVCSCYFYNTVTHRSTWQLDDDAAAVMGVGTAMFNIDIVGNAVDVVAGVIADRQSHAHHPTFAPVHTLHYDVTADRMYSCASRSHRPLWQLDDAGDVSPSDRPRWVEVFDHVTEHCYLHDTLTGDRLWVHTQGGDGVGDGVDERLPVVYDPATDRMYVHRAVAGSEWAADRAPVVLAARARRWWEVWSHDYKRCYFLDTATGAATWIRPGHVHTRVGSEERGGGTGPPPVLPPSDTTAVEDSGDGAAGRQSSAAAVAMAMAAEVSGRSRGGADGSAQPALPGAVSVGMPIATLRRRLSPHVVFHVYVAWPLDATAPHSHRDCVCRSCTDARAATTLSTVGSSTSSTATALVTGSARWSEARLVTSTRAIASVDVAGLAPNTTYKCWYTVTCGDRVCGRSKAVVVVTRPLPPRDVRVRDINAVGGVVVWQSPQGGAHKYVVVVAKAMQPETVVQAITVYGSNQV